MYAICLVNTTIGECAPLVNHGKLKVSLAGHLGRFLKIRHWCINALLHIDLYGMQRNRKTDLLNHLKEIT